MINLKVQCKKKSLKCKLNMITHDIWIKDYVSLHIDIFDNGSSEHMISNSILPSYDSDI